jgi:hypothetical protein
MFAGEQTRRGILQKNVAPFKKIGGADALNGLPTAFEFQPSESHPTKEYCAMRQTIRIDNPLAALSSQHQPQAEVSLDFPLFRKDVKSDNWRKDVTLTRIAEDGSSIMLRYLKSTQFDQETVEFSRGHIAIDTGNLDYTRGIGEHASSEAEFVSMLTLGTRLLAQVTAELGPLPADAVDPLLHVVNGLKHTNGDATRARPRAS